MHAMEKSEKEDVIKEKRLSDKKKRFVNSVEMCTEKGRFVVFHSSNPEDFLVKNCDVCVKSAGRN